MFNDYGKVKDLVSDSFDEIKKQMEEKELTYDEIKDLMVKALYQLKVEDSKGKTEVKRVVTPQVLYGPPSMEKVEVHEVVMPQVLYGPPPIEKVEVHEVVMPQLLYGPPPMMQSEEINVMLDDEYIPGTNVRKPRAQKPGETSDEYLEYLEKYYASFFPNGKGPKAR